MTAKHVIQDDNGKLLPEFILRANMKSGGKDDALISIDKNPPFLHHNLDVDLAVFPFHPMPEKADFLYYPAEEMATTEKISELQISEGTGVFYTGLFSSFLGKSKNHPIIRFGRVSLLPDEKVEYHEVGKPPKKEELFLIECESFGGNSGAPVFFETFRGTEVNINFAGIIKGNFPNVTRVFDEGNETDMFTLENMGISAVVPAQKLHDILYSAEVVKHRDSQPRPFTPT